METLDNMYARWEMGKEERLRRLPGFATIAGRRIPPSQALGKPSYGLLRAAQMRSLASLI